jgi:hypothetical protein
LAGNLCCNSEKEEEEEAHRYDNNNNNDDDDDDERNRRVETDDLLHGHKDCRPCELGRSVRTSRSVGLHDNGEKDLLCVVRVVGILGTMPWPCA